MARHGTGPACWPAHGVAYAWFARGGRAVCDRNTPLHDAANAQQYDVVRLLVANGADVAAANEDGCVPRGMPCRVACRAAWGTMSCGIQGRASVPCRQEEAVRRRGAQGAALLSSDALCFAWSFCVALLW